MLSQADHALVLDIGGFSNDPYWSSTEVDLDDALGHGGGPFPNFKSITLLVRAIRVF